MTAPAHSRLTIPSICCPARIGWADRERIDPRGVRISIALAFSPLPTATVSDALADTVDYAELSKRVVAICCARPYRLLEHLGCTLYEGLRPELPTQVRIWLEVSKEQSPLAEMKESPRFGLGDWDGGRVS